MLTQRMQIDILGALMEGMDAPAGTRVVDFDDPWRIVYQAIRSAPLDKRAQAMLDALAGNEQRERIVGTILGATRIPASKAFQSLKDLAADLPPITWEWPNWIPRGLLSMLAAVPGAGKSFVSLDLARRIVTDGETWPDGQAINRRGNVIYVDAEGVPQIHNERAEQWGMDRTRVYLMLPDTTDMVDFGSQLWRDRLIEMVYALKPVLLVIDSLGSISSKGENNVEDVRELMGWLSRLTLDFNVATVLIHHLRKRGSMQIMDLVTQDDVRGSGHIVAAVRSLIGLSVIKDSDKPDRNGPRRVEVVKTNLCRYPEPIGLEFVPGHPAGVVLKYGPAPEPRKEVTELDQCVQWLEAELANGPVRPLELLESGKAEGYSKATIYRARKSMGTRISNTKGTRAPDNEWELIS